MQDFIFDSRRQAARRRRRMLVRLALLVVLVAGAVGLAVHFFHPGGAESATEARPAEAEPDLLPLPPVDQTRPLSGPLRPQPTPAIVHSAAAEPVATPRAAPPPTEAPAPAAGEQATARKQGQEPAPGVAQAPPKQPSETAAPPPAPAVSWTEHTIGKGDTMAKIFKSLGLEASLLHRLVHSSPTAAGLSRVRPGELLKIARDGEGRLQKLVLRRDAIESLVIERAGDGFDARIERRPVERRRAVASGHIVDSLFEDGRKAGLTDQQIMELAQIFGWDIDFALEIQPGDQFNVVYEEEYVDGKKIRNGPILAAEFVNRGKSYRAVRYTDSQGETNYYAPDGHAKKRAFLRTPVKFTRISSRFTLRRWHPVLKKWRSHKGVDYAAPEGTPVKAAGNGRVSFIGRKGGYGKVIFLRHGGRYTTVYGHLSRFARGLHLGSKVKQGQVIAYVGHTGLATGPHLHYEFRVNGVHRNPLTVKLPRSLKLPRKEMRRFREQSQPLLAELDQLRAKTMVASAKSQ